MLFLARSLSLRFCAVGIVHVFLVFNCFAQQKQIKGVITTETNTPLYGATVAIKNSNISTITDSIGSFSIHVNEGDVLLTSFIGYQSKEIKITTKTVLTITLSQSAVNLDEILVTGYTSQRVKDITGSIAVVKPKDLIAVPAGQVEQMLQGRAAGLTVITSGEPGAPTTIRLHGIGNFGAVTPLYIIDGVPGDINLLNPDDIESLQVLKDAASYSIYGVRGANGVIVVTTKKGRVGQVRITYDGYVGWQQPLNKDLRLLSPMGNAEMIWAELKNSGLVGPNGNPAHGLYGYGPNPVLPDYLFAGPYSDTLFYGDPRADSSNYIIDPASGKYYQIVEFNKNGTDWFHEMYKPAFSQKHTLTVSGGNEKSLYLFSLGYLDQEGTMINTFLKRFSARVNTEFNFKKVFRIGENVQMSYSENPQSGKGFNSPSDAQAALFADPAQPLYDIYGAWNPGYNSGHGPDDNPVGRRVHAKDNKGKTWEVFGNAYAAVDFLKYFTAKTSFGGSVANVFSYDFKYASYDYPLVGGYPNHYNESSGYNSSWTWTTTVNYAQTFSEHSIKALVGTEMVSSTNRETGGGSTDLPFSNPNYWNLDNGDALTKTNYSLASVSKLASFLSRVDYGFKDKYFLSVTLRRDGASVFGPENRFGWFPAISPAWRITEENFLSNSRWITDLKLRGSWGRTGFYGNTDPANQFTLFGGSPYDAFYDINGNSTGNIQRGYRTIRIGNPRTGWQEDEVVNVGLDGIFWNGKLTVNADWYYKKTTGLLFPVSLPALLGDVIAPNVNVGNIRNTGIDLTIGSKGKFSKDWRWDVLATFTHYDNNIVKLNEIPFFFDAYGMVKNEVGYPIGSFFGYKIIGFFNDSADVAKSPSQPAAAPGRFKYADTNGRDNSGRLTGKPDGNIDEADRIHFGSPHPKFTLGLNIAITFRNFDFSTFFYASIGNDVLNLPRRNFEILPVVGNNTALYDSWRPDHKDATAPILESFYTFSNATTVNSYPLEDGSYIRNKSLVVGYSFPRTFLSKMKMEKLRMYVQVANLFTITNYSGLDPELSRSGGFSWQDPFVGVSTFGIDAANYPGNQIQFLVGINLGL